MAFDYDLFVIGGGSGGVRAARIAAGTHGAKVALAEEYRMGGTCVIRGCVPKKLMVYASEYSGLVSDAQSYGWDATVGAFDWYSFRGKLDAELDRLEKAYRSGLSGAGVTVFDCRAVLVDGHCVGLADGQVIRAKHILVATGGAPFVPAFPGSELAITSNEIFRLEALPNRVLIVGGGYIASEFACILNGMGCEVAQYYRGPQILRGFDDEARNHVADAMRVAGVDIQCNTDVARLEACADGIRAMAEDGSAGVFDKVLFATGRNPNSAGLGLEALGVELGRNGQIVVDGFSQTAVPSIFAVGDVTDRIALTPVAIREGHAFADTVFGGLRRKVDHSLFASAVFTQPEIGTIGLTEEAARDSEAIEVYAANFRPMRTAFAGRDDKALMKLIVSQKSRKVLGCHIVGPGAGEMIQLVAIAVTMGATKEQFDATIAVHPTMAEELVTMRSLVRQG
ncbi:glutathione-disulfide reductase [Pseudorhodobacter sp.]|uniref:glutathione-disulfide reductase n=1 Tax=Pseudorhodobacter sp. TaxID=1934400 RepID=UPI0026498F08|nr:glutathione-disulfide reductase [Pseudorhodobacter sp.]MDN5786285.1 glutathione-disulfide reductase [Pseudorhodobacter sp.]